MTTFIRRTLLCLSGGLALGIMSASAFAQKAYDEGASDTEIKIGHTNPYSGNFSSYGQIGKALEAVFKSINDEGGINGRKLTFITYDDGFSPPKTVEMTRKLIEEDNVLFLFQTLGTAPNTAIHKYVNSKKIPHIFISSGASKWGNPKAFPWSMGWQPDYMTENAIYAKHMLATVKNPKVAILMQNDDSGKDQVAGFKQGLGKDNQKLIAQIATFEGTDPNVDSQIIQLKNTGANVLVISAGPKHTSQAIKKAAEIGWARDLTFLQNVSISIGSVLRPAGLDNAKGAVTAQFLKEITDPQWENSADVKAFKEFMAKYMPNADLKDWNHTYGYAVAYSLVHVLKAAGDSLTRENIMKQAASLQGKVVPLAMDGITLNTSATDFYPLQSMQLARFNGEKWELFGEVLSNESK